MRSDVAGVGSRLLVISRSVSFRILPVLKLGYKPGILLFVVRVITGHLMLMTDSSTAGFSALSSR